MNRLGFFWISFFASIFLAWCLLYKLGHHAHHQLSHSMVMWALMALAMMLPTALPLIHDYAALTEKRPNRIVKLWLMCLGYSVIWIGFAIPASLAQSYLILNHLVSIEGIFIESWRSAVMLIAVGLYQFSPLKQACLRQCRQPAAFILSHWHAGFWGDFRLGFIHGLYCLGCCWALMLLGFVGGVMNLIWMGVAMVIMTIEKWPIIGKYLDRPLGIVLSMSGIVILVDDYFSLNIL